MQKKLFGRLQPRNEKFYKKQHGGLFIALQRVYENISIQISGVVKFSSTIWWEMPHISLHNCLSNFNLTRIPLV